MSSPSDGGVVEARDPWGRGAAVDPGRRLVLAVDQGTSATKAAIVDAQGMIRRQAAVPLTQTFPRPGWAEQDPAQIWASVQQAVGECLAGVEPADVIAVGLSTQRESTVLWDRATGEPLGAVLGWQDTRGSGWCDRLREAGHAERVRSVTGLPLDAMFSASKAAALLDRYDPDRTRAAAGQLCLGTIDSWLLWKIGGRHLIEAGNAARTQLLDITARRWDPWLLELFAIPAPALPTVVGSTGPFTSAAGLDPRLADVPVTGVLGDSHAALFAHAGWQTGQVKVTYGTGSSVMGVTSTRPAPDSGVARTIAWEVDGVPAYALEGNVRSSGATLVWLSRLFGTTPARIATEAAEDSGGVVIVPAFTGLGAPWWDDRARGSISGLSEASRLDHVARAGLESIAFQIEDVVAALEATAGPVRVILADGGPSANALLMQLQADTSGREVQTSEVAELSALGAAHLAGLGAGLWTWSDLEQLTRTRTPYPPTSTPAQRSRQRQHWHAAVDAVRTQGKAEQP